MSIQNKIIFAVGGTGGHVYPAIALMEALQRKEKNLKCHFLGGELKNNPYLCNKKIAFTSIKSAPLGKKSYKILWGFLQSLYVLRKEKPQCIIGFGSYYALPVLMAAKILGYPYILHEQNALPGKVTRIFSGSARFVAGHFPQAKKYLRGTFVESSPSLYTGERLTFVKRKKLCIVFGGSLGALFFNEYLPSLLQKVVQKDEWQLFHITGRAHAHLVKKINATYAEKGIEAQVVPFCEGLGSLLEIADCAIARAGGSTIFELLHYAVPAFLLPYPYAADDHQWYNAKVMEDEVKGAYLMRQNELLQGSGEEKLAQFFKENSVMKQNIKHYFKDRCYQPLSDVILQSL